MDKWISFRASENDRQRLNALATKAGLTPSEFLRSVVRSADVQKQEFPVLRFSNNNTAPTFHGESGAVASLLLR